MESIRKQCGDEVFNQIKRDFYQNAEIKQKIFHETDATKKGPTATKTINDTESQKQLQNELSIIKSCVRSELFHLEDLVQAGELQYMSTTLKDIVENLVQDYHHKRCTFTEFIQNCLTPIMYLLKRQQNLDDFMNVLTAEYQSLQQVRSQDTLETINLSLRMLLHILLLNSDVFLRRIVVSLISKRNPVPFIMPPIQSCNEKEQFEIVPAVIHVWNHTRPTILSFSIGCCQGKSTLLNQLFQSAFEQTMESTYFQQTIDIDFGYCFNPERSLNIADTHGTINKSLLSKIAPLFDGFLIHIDNKYFDQEPKPVLEYLEILPEEKFQMIIVRDFSGPKQVEYSSNLQTLFDSANLRLSQKISMCALPNVSNTMDRKVKIAIDGLRKEILAKITNEIKSPIDPDETKQHLQQLIDRNYTQYLRKMDNIIQPLKKRLLHTNVYKREQNCPLYLKFRKLCELRQKLKNLAFYGSESYNMFVINTELFELESELDPNTRRLSPIQCGYFFDAFVEILKSENRLMSLDLLASELKYALLNLGGDKLAGDLSVESAFLSLEALWRNSIVCYEHTTDQTKSLIRNSYCDLIAAGFPFEIIDGDNFHFQQKFLTQVLDEFRSQRILVISIIGPQNSGKSTLLNYMFGTLFDVRDGRCTRGVYGSLVKIAKLSQPCQKIDRENYSNKMKDIDYIMLIDTEGLLAIEKGDKEYDRRLVLFSLAVSHLVIVNMMSDINQTLQDMLTLCADSLKQIGVNTTNKPMVHFVLNQKADPNTKNHGEAIRKVIEDLKEKKLAEVIDISENTFHALPSAFKKERLLNDTKSPCFLRTEPDFIERTQQLCDKIIQSAQESYHRTKNIFSDPAQWLRTAINIFDTLQKFPDLTYFKDINERQQDNQIREAIGNLITEKLEANYRQQMIEDTYHLTEGEIRKKFQAQFDVHQNEFDNKLEELFQVTTASDRIRERCKQFLKRQITEICNAWCTAAIQAHDREQMETLVRDGSLDLRNPIDDIIEKGKTMNKKQAQEVFVDIWEKKVESIKNNFKPTEQLKQAIKFVYGNYNIFEKESLQSLQTILDNVRFIQELSGKPSPQEVFHSIKEAFTENLMKQCENALDISRKPMDTNTVYTLDMLNNFQYLRKELLSNFYISGILQEEILKQHSQQVDHRVGQHDHKEKPKRKIFMRGIPAIGNFIGFSSAHSTYEISKKLKAHPLRFDFAQAVHETILNEMRHQPLTRSNILCIPKFFDTILNDVKSNLHGNSLVCYRPIELDLVQKVVGSINTHIRNANLELSIFKLSVSQQLKSLVHTCVLILMTVIYFDEQKDHFTQQLSTMAKEKESLLNYFISMVVPDAECDEEGGKVFAKKVMDTIQTSFMHDAQKIIARLVEGLQQGGKQAQDNQRKSLNRKYIQQLCDGKLLAASADEEWLLRYITAPDDIIVEEFKELWGGVENTINQEVNLKKNEWKNVLIDFFNQIQSRLFRLENEGSSVQFIDDVFASAEGNAEENLKNKQQCMVLLLFRYLSGERILPDMSFSVSNRTYTLKPKGAKIFENISKELKPSDQLVNVMKKICESNDTNDKRMVIAIIKNLHVFLQSIIDTREKIVNAYEKTPSKFAELDKDQTFNKLLDKARGCTSRCPCCQRPCDVDHSLTKSNPGDEDNRHACQTGHQLRAMAGTKFEITNEASLFQCEQMEDYKPIVVKGTKKKWLDFKKDHPDWDFSNSIKSDDLLKLRGKFLHVWDKVGQRLCEMHQMTFVTKNTEQPAPKPFHYIMLLDSSGSMGIRNMKPWNDLMEGVKQFLEIRIESGSKDRVTIITFDQNAKVVFCNKEVNSVDTSLIKFTNGGTDFGKAFELLITTIKQIESSSSQSSSTDRLDYIIVFMSDGDASYPNSQLDSLCALKAKIHQFWTIALGNTKMNVLEQINDKMGGLFKELKDSGDLVQVYAEIAKC